MKIKKGVYRYFEIIDDEMELSSGETEELDVQQDTFNLLFDSVEEDSSEICLKPWTLRMNNQQVDEKQADLFFQKVGEIKYISSYKYLLRFLMLRYCLAIGEKNMKGLWKCMEGEEPALTVGVEEKKKNEFYKKLRRMEGKEVVSFERPDYETLLSLILGYIKEEYLQNGGKNKRDWPGYFWNLLTHLDEKGLKEFALGLGLDYDTFSRFRKKVLNLSDLNLYKRDNVFLYLVLKYAQPCGQSRYFEAYEKLKKMYPKQKNKSPEEKLSTREIKSWFREYIGSGEALNENLKDKLFCEVDLEIKKEIDRIDSMRSQDKKRSAESIFLEEWEKLKANTEIFERDSLAKEELNKEEEESYWGNQKAYKWLYGEKVYKRVHNRNIDIKESEMALLGDGEEDYFLDSEVFLNTRIRDNTIQAFPTDEERQRNLLLTVIFLNYVLDSENLAEEYEDRVADLKIRASEKISECGFQLLHSGKMYDVFLKLLLSCDSPAELFRYVWRKKTKSLERE